jgi:uncharacterized phage-associated protein
MVCTPDDVAAAVIERLGPVDPKKLQKLVFYAQAWHLAITNEPLFGDPIEAWRDGPVVRALYRKHRREWQPVAAWLEGDVSRISPNSLAVVDVVCATYGSLNGESLSQLAHSERPWIEARGDRLPDEPSTAPISEQTMGSYYRRRYIGGRAASDWAVGGAGLQRLSDAELATAIHEIRESLPDAPETDPAPMPYDELGAPTVVVSSPAGRDRP